eukprot:934290-Prymnesium_polylepis.1
MSAAWRDSEMLTGLIRAQGRTGDWRGAVRCALGALRDDCLDAGSLLAAVEACEECGAWRASVRLCTSLGASGLLEPAALAAAMRACAAGERWTKACDLGRSALASGLEVGCSSGTFEAGLRSAQASRQWDLAVLMAHNAGTQLAKLSLSSELHSISVLACAEEEEWELGRRQLERAIELEARADVFLAAIRVASAAGVPSLTLKLHDELHRRVNTTDEDAELAFEAAFAAAHAMRQPLVALELMKQRQPIDWSKCSATMYACLEEGSEGATWAALTAFNGGPHPDFLRGVLGDDYALDARRFYDLAYSMRVCDLLRDTVAEAAEAEVSYDQRYVEWLSAAVEGRKQSFMRLDDVPIRLAMYLRGIVEREEALTPAETSSLGSLASVSVSQLCGDIMGML